MSKVREIAEGLQYQGEDETIIYTLTTTNWASSPTSPTATIYSIDASGDKTDVTSTKMSGSASANGDVITLPSVTGLVAGTLYRVEVKFVVSGNTFEAVAWIKGER